MPEEGYNPGSSPKADDSRIFDVAKPGKTDPNPSSRPLIVGHRPLLSQDPMVKPADNNLASQDDQTPSGAPAKAADETENPASPTDKPARSLFGRKNGSPLEKPAADQLAKEEPAPSVPSQKQPPDDSNSPGNTTEALLAADQQVAPAKLAAQKAQQEAAAREEQLNKLAQSKTYALPISQKRSTRLLLTGVVGLALVLAAAVFIIMSKS